jgi:transposase
MPAWGAGGVETRSAIGASSPSAFRVFQRRSRAGPRAWRESSLLGHSAGGRPSERLMRRLGMPVSDTTILAVLKKHAGARSESSAVAAVRVAGVDDWAWRKGHNYGTIIVDLERREVVEVLADRSAATTASWFKIPWGGG